MFLNKEANTLKMSGIFYHPWDHVLRFSRY